MNGIGRKIYGDGSIYNGELMNGKPHGKGLITFGSDAPDIKTYEGDFFNGMAHGKGVTTYHPEQNGSHFGLYENGYRQGKGTSTWPDGSIYEGNFDRDKFHGLGKYTSPSGKIFHGFFKDGTPESTLSGPQRWQTIFGLKHEKPIGLKDKDLEDLEKEEEKNAGLGGNKQRQSKRRRQSKRQSKRR